MIKALLFTLLALVVVIIGWHLFFPFLGALIVFTAGAWAALIVSVVILCVAILLAFVFAGAGIFIFGIIAFIWVILAITLFPIIFPVVAPLFIIFLFISYFCRKK